MTVLSKPIPPELMLEIVEHSLNENYAYRRLLIHMSHLCTAARNLILSTSKLWRSILVEGTPGSIELAELYKARSGNLSLQVEVHIADHPQGSVLLGRQIDFISKSIDRIVCLRVHSEDHRALSTFCRSPACYEAPLLEKLQLTYRDPDLSSDTQPRDLIAPLPLAPRLHALKIQSILPLNRPQSSEVELLRSLELKAPFAPTWLYWGIRSTLSCFSNLDSLTLDGESGLGNYLGTTRPPSSHPISCLHLRKLTITDAHYRFIAWFLTFLEAPALEQVRITEPLHDGADEMEVEQDRGHSEIKRHRSVRKLHIDWQLGVSDEPGSGFLVFLRTSFPLITQLGLAYGRTSSLGEWNSPSRFFPVWPNVTTLVFQADLMPTQVNPEVILQAIADCVLWSGKIKILRMGLQLPVETDVGKRILAMLRERVESVEVGKDVLNFEYLEQN